MIFRERHSLLSERKPFNDQPKGGALTSSWLGSWSSLLFVVITGGGAAMIHWLSDMGPVFAIVYLGILGGMLGVAIWHVLRTQVSNASGSHDEGDLAPVTTANEIPQPAPPASPLPDRQPSWQRVLIIYTILIGYFLTVPALIILAAQFGLKPWMQNAWFFFAAGIIFLGWLSVLGLFCGMLFDAIEARWPRARGIKEILISVWRFAAIFNSHHPQ
jgi:hypothetical protein